MAEFEDYIIVLFLCLLSYIILKTILTQKKNNGRSPPSPPALPIIGHLHLISKLPHQSFHKLSTQYGPVMQLFLGSLPCVVVSTPEMVKEFLKTNEAYFSNRYISAVIHYITYDSKGFAFAPYGEHWKFMRKLCMSELLGGITLNQLLPLRQQETQKFLNLLQKKGEAGEAINVGGELVSVTNNIITRMIMSTTCYENNNHEAEEIRKMVVDTAELSGKFAVSEFIWFCKNLDLQGMNKRLREIMERFDRIMERVIEEHEDERKRRKESGEGVAQRRDLLDILLEIREDQRSEIKLTKENIKASILEIFMAGTDTSATTTEWALAELINHPHVMEKARQEIDLLTGKCRLIDESDLPNMPYLRAIIKETLRIHPSVPLIARESSENCIVSGYQIPAKSLLLVNLWAMGRDPNMWEKPLEFRPERFMNEEKQLEVRGQGFQLIPFGTGRRMCPGASLALQFVPTNLAAMIQSFEWKVVGDGNGTVSMDEKPAMSLQMAQPLICVPMPRFNFNIPSNV